MGLKESLKELQEKEKLSVKREIRKELSKIRKHSKKCSACKDKASYQLKASNEYYCRDCALEYFGQLGYLKKI
jgi:ribosomal protein L37AE/L43A